MPRTKRKTYYWDSCAFIAWMDGGKGHRPEVIAGLEEIAKEITENKANLCTSVVTEIEVLRGKLTQDQAQRFENLFKRRNVSQITLDGKIARKASEIRDYYNSRGVKINQPDSTHLATAILYEVDEFDTMDGGGDRVRRNDLLPLDGDVMGYPLHIRVPTGVPLLFSDLDKAEEIE